MKKTMIIFGLIFFFVIPSILAATQLHDDFEQTYQGQWYNYNDALRVGTHYEGDYGYFLNAIPALSNISLGFADDVINVVFYYYFNSSANPYIYDPHYLFRDNAGATVFQIEGNNKKLEVYDGINDKWTIINQSDATDHWNKIDIVYYNSNDTCLIKANESSYQYFNPCRSYSTGYIQRIILQRQGTAGTIIDDIYVCDGMCGEAVDIPPINSSWDVTSGNVVAGQDTTTWNYGGIINITSDLLSLNVTTNEISNGSCILDYDYNYTKTVSLNPDYKFTSTEVTEHEYGVFDSISIGEHCLYCSFIDSSGNEFANSSSGCLKLHRWSYPGVILSKPDNASTVGIPVQFNFTATTDSSLVNCSLYGNWNGWGIKQTIYNVLNGTTTNFNPVTIPKGSYEWNVECCDKNHLCSFAENNYMFTLLNQLPSHSTPVLNSSTGYNSTADNLVCYNQSTYDADNDNVTNIYNWRKDSNPLEALNLAFETDAEDYSGNNNDGVVYNATLVAGKYGNAYSFDGDDYIYIADNISLDFTNAKSWELWLKRDSSSAETLFDKSNAASQRNYKLEFNADNRLVFSYSVAGGAGAEGWLTKTQADFNEGSYSNTEWDTDHVELSSGQGSGTYTSAVFDANSTVNWDGIGWGEAIPYGEGLPDNKGIDSGADMAGNVLLMHMNEASGTIVDSSGEGNNGAYNGALYSQAGKLNTAIGFDGSNNYIDVGTSNSLKPTAFTISAWFKTGDNSAQIFVSSAKWGNYYGYLIRPGAISGQILSQIQSASQTANNLITATYADDGWHHYALVYNSISNQFDGWFDGALLNSSTTTVDIAYESDANIYIGWAEAGGATPTGISFNGTIDEVAIYNRSLSATEISNIYKRGALELNLTARSCDDAVCSGESWTDVIDNPPQSLSVDDNRYFQYKFNFGTDDVDYSPELYNVTVDYTVYGVNVTEVNITSNSSVTDTNWHHVGITYGNNNLKLYLDGNLDNGKTETNLPQHKDNDLYIGRDYSGTSYFTGDMDEMRIYDRALSAQQIQAHYNLEYNKIVSQELSPSDTWRCDITPNDGYADGATLSSNNLTIIGNIFDITFKLVDSYTGEQISTGPTIDFSCTNGLNINNANNPTGPYVFYEGTYNCTFIGTDFTYFDKTIIFIADADKTVDVLMSEAGKLTPEEHYWLESVYNCLYLNVSCNLQ